MPGDFVGTFASFFTNLTPSQRNELEKALNSAQNSKEITSLESSSQLLKRKVDQRLPIPQPTARSTIRGATIEWPALPDQRVNFYEIDVSDESNFNVVETYPNYGLVIVLDSITSTKFVRVRGVRRDGTTTPYSDTVIVSPVLFNINFHTEEVFYVGPITGTDPVTILGGENTDLAYTPTNQNGTSMVFGFISTYGDPNVGMLGLRDIFADVVIVRKDVDGLQLDEEIIWRMSMSEFFNSQSIGPFPVAHSGTLDDTIEVRLEMTDRTGLANGDPRTADRTWVLWAHLTAVEQGV